MRFEHAVACEPFILAEGAVIERLRRDPDNSPDPHIAHAGFIYQEKTRSALEAVYRGYRPRLLSADDRPHADVARQP